MNHTGKCPSWVPTLGCQPTLPPGTGGFSTAPPPGLLSGRLSSRPAVRARQHQPYLEEEVMKLFSTQRTMKALWQLAAFCPSSLPASSEEAWPVAAAASVRHVSQ